MNTLEWMPIFLPSLWLFAIYISDGIAAALGLVWIVGRILYMTGYSQAAEKRGTGLWDSGRRGRHSLAGRARRDRLAARSCVMTGRRPRLDSVSQIAWLSDQGSPRSHATQSAIAHFVSGQPLSLADGNALSPGTTASCL